VASGLAARVPWAILFQLSPCGGAVVQIRGMWGLGPRRLRISDPRGLEVSGCGSRRSCSSLRRSRVSRCGPRAFRTHASLQPSSTAIAITSASTQTALSAMLTGCVLYQADEDALAQRRRHPEGLVVEVHAPWSGVWLWSPALSSHLVPPLLSSPRRLGAAACVQPPRRPPGTTGEGSMGPDTARAKCPGGARHRHRGGRERVPGTDCATDPPQHS
jgi:hypothetical protein